MEPTEPGTINDLLADAKAAGHHVTARLVTDWVSLGLLDRPQRQPRGRGKGSSKARYPPNQRRLFLTLLDKRRTTTRVSTLARVPVFIWLYWGDEYVPLRQVRRAFMTWLGAAEVSSRQRARETARLILGQLDHPDATPRARREFAAVVTDLAYTGRLDSARLEQAARRVFEPDGVRRSVGHPAAQLTIDSIVGLISARLAAVQRHKSGRVTDEHFLRARQAHHMHLAEYMALQSQLAAQAPHQDPDLYNAVTLQALADSCCVDLLTIVELEISNQGARNLSIPDITHA